jgi:hypothetical protein
MDAQIFRMPKIAGNLKIPVMKKEGVDIEDI